MSGCLNRKSSTRVGAPFWGENPHISSLLQHKSINKLKDEPYHVYNSSPPEAHMQIELRLYGKFLARDDNPGLQLATEPAALSAPLIAYEARRCLRPLPRGGGRGARLNRWHKLLPTPPPLPPPIRSFLIARRNRGEQERQRGTLARC